MSFVGKALSLSVKMFKFCLISFGYDLVMEVLMDVSLGYALMHGQNTGKELVVFTPATSMRRVSKKDG